MSYNDRGAARGVSMKSGQIRLRADHMTRLGGATLLEENQKIKKKSPTFLTVTHQHTATPKSTSAGELHVFSASALLSPLVCSA